MPDTSWSEQLWMAAPFWCSRHVGFRALEALLRYLHLHHFPYLRICASSRQTNIQGIQKRFESVQRHAEQMFNAFNTI